MNKLTKGIQAVAITVLLVFCITGCMSPPPPIYWGEPGIYHNRNDIGFEYDIGLLQHFDGDYKGSNDALLESKHLIEEAFTKDISDNFARFATGNVYKTEYGGEDYENMYVNVFTALNFYHLGDPEKAMVEIRDMNEKLPWIKDQYEAQKAKLAQRFNTIVWGETSYYTNSALARYLGLLMWRASGNMDSARIDAQELNNAFNDQPLFYKNPIPPELVMRGAGANATCDELSIPSGMARLNVLSFTGLSPYKMTSLNVKYHYRPSSRKILGFRPSPVDRIEIAIDGGQRFNLSLLEPIGRVMQEVYETRDIHARAARQHTVVRFATDVSGLVTELPASIVNLLLFVPTLGAYDMYDQRQLKLVSGSDMRQSFLLPEKAYAGGVNLAPGTYNLTITYYSGSRVVESNRKENVTVQAGKLNLIEDFSQEYVDSNPGMDNEDLPDFPGRLPAPENVKIRGVNPSTMLVKWDPVPDASMYIVKYGPSSFGAGSVAAVSGETECYVTLFYDGDQDVNVTAVGNGGLGVTSGTAQMITDPDRW